MAPERGRRGQRRPTMRTLTRTLMLAAALAAMSAAPAAAATRSALPAHAQVVFDDTMKSGKYNSQQAKRRALRAALYGPGFDVRKADAYQLGQLRHPDLGVAAKAMSLGLDRDVAEVGSLLP